MTDTVDTPVVENRFAWQPVLGAGLGLIALLTVLLAAFAWPASELEPRELPIGLVAPAGAAPAIEQQLTDRAGEDAFAVTNYDDRAAAVAAIEDREVYGALVITPAGTEALTATGAGPVPAQLVTQLATGAAARGDQPTITDVVPAAAGDPRGIVFNSAALPLALGGILIGAVASIALPRTRERLVAATLVSLGSGFALAGLLQGWLDAAAGSYWALAGVIGLGTLAIALPIVGLRHLIGPPAIGLVALLVMLVGNPLSGIPSAPELLPLGWLGQLLPPGAVGSALRGTSYFDGAGTAWPLTVLACWAVAGLALALVPRRE